MEIIGNQAEASKSIHMRWREDDRNSNCSSSLMRRMGEVFSCAVSDVLRPDCCNNE